MCPELDEHALCVGPHCMHGDGQRPGDFLCRFAVDHELEDLLLWGCEVTHREAPASLSRRAEMAHARQYRPDTTRALIGAHALEQCYQVSQLVTAADEGGRARVRCGGQSRGVGTVSQDDELDGGITRTQRAHSVEVSSD